MGGTKTTGGGGTGEGVIPSTIDLTPLLNLLSPDHIRGGHGFEITTISITTAATFQRLFDNGLSVRMAIIQNISIEDVTITKNLSSSGGTGIILNAASGGGKAGGSLPVNNVDLQQFCFVRTTAGVTLAVYYEY
jgi:hypothetical protein